MSCSTFTWFSWYSPWIIFSSSLCYMYIAVSFVVFPVCHSLSQSITVLLKTIQSFAPFSFSPSFLQSLAAYFIILSPSMYFSFFQPFAVCPNSQLISAPPSHSTLQFVGFAVVCRPLPDLAAFRSHSLVSYRAVHTILFTIHDGGSGHAGKWSRKFT